MEATKELISMATILHIIFVLLIVVIVIRLIFVLKNHQDISKFRKVYERWVLLYRAALSAVAFSGVVVMAIAHFHVRWQVWLMVVATILLFALSIKESFLYRQITYRDSSENREFFSFSKYAYLASGFIIVLTIFVTLLR